VSVDNVQIEAFGIMLDMIDSNDFKLANDAVRERVAAGTMNKETEAAYKQMVDDKLKERGELNGTD